MSADRSVRSYARDTLGEPVSKLGDMFTAIVAGTFKPDAKSLAGSSSSKVVNSTALDGDSSDGEQTESDNEDVLETVASTTLGNSLWVAM